MDLNNLPKNAAPSVFISSSRTLYEIEKHISSIVKIGCSRSASDSIPSFIWYFFNFEIILFGDHGLVNDVGINFELFNFQINFVGIGLDGDYEQKSNLALFLADYMAFRISEDLKCKTMLVNNLQRKLTEYGQ